MCAAGCFVPDCAILWLVSIGLFHMLRAGNIRLHVASFIGIATVAIYSALTWFLAPDSVVVQYVISNWQDAFQRNPVWDAWPIWLLLSTCVLTAIGLWSQMALWLRYNQANVRIQTRLLLVAPFYWLSLLSCLFPTLSGNSMLSILWASAIYFPILYIMTYGWPKMPTRAKADPYRRSYSRRSRKRR